MATYLSHNQFTEEMLHHPDIVHLGCMAHACRPFAELVKIAKTTGKSHQAIAYFQKLYALEKLARDNQYTHEQRYQLRLEKAKPILDEMKLWLEQSIKHAVPQSKLSNALFYMQQRWQELTNYLSDGMLEIDNNGAENQIRPFALGRKNWLFSGSLYLYSFAIRHPQKTKALIAIDAIAGNYLMPEQAGKLAQAFYMSNLGLWITAKCMIYFPKVVIKNFIQTEGYLDPVRLDERVQAILNNREYLDIMADLLFSIADYQGRKLGTINDIALGQKAKWYDFAKINSPAFIIHGTHDADVKFYNGVFAYEQLPSEEKERFWIEYGTHLGFFFAPQAAAAQQKFREFIIKHG